MLPHQTILRWESNISFPEALLPAVDYNEKAPPFRTGKRSVYSPFNKLDIARGERRHSYIL